MLFGSNDSKRLLRNRKYIMLSKDHRIESKRFLIASKLLDTFCTVAIVHQRSVAVLPNLLKSPANAIYCEGLQH